MRYMSSPAVGTAAAFVVVAGHLFALRLFPGNQPMDIFQTIPGGMPVNPMVFFSRFGYSKDSGTISKFFKKRTGMKLKHLFIVLSVVAFATAAAQKARIRAADRDYENFAYIDAIKAYERVAAKGYRDAGMFKKLGNAYYFNSEFGKAEKWYAELFAMDKDMEPEYYYRYSQSLKAAGKYDQANAMLDQFNARSGNDARAELYGQNKDYLQTIEDNSGRYSMENAGINSEFQDFGTSFFGGQLVFASSRAVKGASRKIQKWNNQAFTGLYASTVDGDGNLMEPERFASGLDSKFNESTPVFTDDGRTMYFTRNNYNEGKRQKDSRDVTLLKLYRATFMDGQFIDAVELPFNDNEFSNAHPALSTDEKTLYFASDRPGSLGQSDIYKVAVNADGTFGTPENLGGGINTEGKETFPFMSNDGELYFSSDGHPGLGGLDVFVSKMEGSSFGGAINVGRPVNGPMDDFAFMIDARTRSGFFSSNREGGTGYDDIYRFREIRKLACEQLLAGTVSDRKVGAILDNVKVALFDEKMNKIKEVYTDAGGAYSFDAVGCRRVYYVRSEREGYDTVEEMVVIGSETGETKLSLEMEPTMIPVKVGDDLAKAFGIGVIYFDLDRWNIRPDAAADLAKIVEVMRAHPTMKVDVRSHTDSRQARSYNQRLSDSRARATIAWLVAQGIEADRLTGKGYGETEPIDGCSGVDCTERQHQANRRSEFIIMAL